MLELPSSSSNAILNGLGVSTSNVGVPPLQSQTGTNSWYSQLLAGISIHNNFRLLYDQILWVESLLLFCGNKIHTSFSRFLYCLLFTPF